MWFTRGWLGFPRALPSPVRAGHIHYTFVTDITRECAYNDAMAGNELNRDNHEFTHNGHSYWIYTFMTRAGILSFRVWHKVDEGQAKPGEARSDLIERLKKHLQRP